MACNGSTDRFSAGSCLAACASAEWLVRTSAAGGGAGAQSWGTLREQQHPARSKPATKPEADSTAQASLTAHAVHGLALLRLVQGNLPQALQGGGRGRNCWLELTGCEGVPCTERWGEAAGVAVIGATTRGAATCHLQPTPVTVPAALQTAAHLVLLALLALADLGAHEAALLRIGEWGGGQST